MAERIQSLRRTLGRPRVYPWDEWADGSAWAIRRGEDFDVSVKSMASMLRVRAQNTGLGVTHRVDGDVIRFQFFARDVA